MDVRHRTAPDERLALLWGASPRVSAPPHPAILSVPAADKARLKVLFLAKHALAGGQPDAVDGTHAVYHHEMLTTLRQVGLNVVAANSYEALFDRPDADFVVTLLNRGGFVNSEMLAPLLLRRHALPFLGASPILRGLSDDKHLMKCVAERRGVPVTPWAIVRQGQSGVPEPAFAWDRLVVKPNASSASWGVRIHDGWAAAREHAEELLAAGHDVILEAYAPLIDLAVPVVGADGAWLLPSLGYRPPDRPDEVRSYAEKRNLSGGGDDPLERVEDAEVAARLDTHVRALLPELWPFDYGRFEFRYDPATGDLRFMEVNLSCNLWSKKTISRSARSIGVSHAELVETIVAHSLLRQGVIETVERPGRAFGRGAPEECAA
ncbi:phosphoribosylglycinamide synthetase [Sphingosinicella sp. LHD-64]|uniref:phosphoribosylglycinamide synthetase n=1 Tax=Sphingosinicella sp. LHD-64 TaxID=3072139 RepID=UPI00281050ED|nr:phosphoribosylglycinamide synthetase [Sphingosinicella sp. LHD-64]MDQ8756373.1 phosphoribosylglycinamide synthetase [Sphingosinicella sp. LHD-64]